MRRLLLTVFLLASVVTYAQEDELERGWRNPPPDARPHTYWLWLNGHVDPATARAELQAMKDAGFSGVLLFDMGARGPKDAQPPAGPAFLSPEWLKQFKESVQQAKDLGLQVDFSVVSSWDLGGHWIQPKHGSMGLYPVDTVIEGGGKVDLELPFPEVPPAAPKGSDGKPAFWQDAAVLAVRDAKRAVGHEFVIKLDNETDRTVTAAVLDNGNPGTSPVTASMSPVREFAVELSDDGRIFKEVVRGTLKRDSGPQRFDLPAGTRGEYVRLRLLSAHDSSRTRWTLGDFALLDGSGQNVAGAYVADTSRRGATMVRSTAPLAYGPEWNRDNLHDGDINGPRGVFSTAGLPPFEFASTKDLIDVSKHVDTNGRLQWEAPAGRWAILRYVVMNTGERLKVPSPNSDGWATDHFNPEATGAHMDYVIDKLRSAFGDLSKSGLANLYLASYEVVGPVWSPRFIADFNKKRGYDMTPWLPAIFGARVGTDDMTERFLFDYRKTLSEVLIEAYYGAARDAARKAGLGIKSEAGGPGPPVHNVPVDSLLANAAVDEIQGEFWPFRWNADGLWVVKETASAGHIYDKPRVHMEAFSSFDHWSEGPQDLKPSADRVFSEGGNHMVWHTWTHAPPEAGKPGWVYLAGTHINRNRLWWPKVKPFVDYLSRSSFLLQRGKFVADVLYYYGDGGYRFVGPRRVKPELGPGYDYDYTNSDVILNRLTVRDGRFVLPDGTSYAVLVLPDEEDMHPAVLEKIAQFVAAGGAVAGPQPLRAVGLEGYPASDKRVQQLTTKLWREGGVISDKSVRDVLLEKGIGPDFGGQGELDFTHRRDGSTDIYFVRNTLSKPVKRTASFRVTGRQPELWDSVSGNITQIATYKTAGTAIEVELELPANGSVFVVFRRPAGKASETKPAGIERILDVRGPWSVSFERGHKAPEAIQMLQLDSWTKHEDPGVRYFSGTARYRASFTLPPGFRQNGRVLLDLGNLWTIGEVWLNDKPLGIVWTHPFRADCTEALREGTNELAIEVTNTWFNRLVGDALLPENQRTTRTNVTITGNKPWAKQEPRASGLFGPVRLIAGE